MVILVAVLAAEVVVVELVVMYMVEWVVLVK
jgi:hypothetical protein